MTKLFLRGRRASSKVLQRVRRDLLDVGSRYAELRLKEVLRRALGTRIGSVARLTRGTSNLFRVETASGLVAVRVLRPQESVVHAGEIAALLASADIKHARSLYSAGPSSGFPWGIVVQEWLPGDLATDVLTANRISSGELYSEVGRQLRQLHDHPVAAFGPAFWRGPHARQSSFLGYASEQPLRPRAEAILRAVGLKSASVLTNAVSAACALYSLLEDDVRPVLVHGDIHPGNLMVVGGDVVLIDWWNAHGGSWVSDFARTRSLRGVEPNNALHRGYGTAGGLSHSFWLLDSFHAISYQLEVLEYLVQLRQWTQAMEVVKILATEVERWRAAGSPGSSDA